MAIPAFLQPFHRIDPPNPLLWVLISTLINFTHFCTTPKDIFHCFPADLHWHCCHSAMLWELISRAAKPLVWSLKEAEDQEVTEGTKPIPLLQDNKPQTPLCHPAPARQNSSSYLLLQTRRKLQKICKNSQCKSLLPGLAPSGAFCHSSMQILEQGGLWGPFQTKPVCDPWIWVLPYELWASNHPWFFLLLAK